MSTAARLLLRDEGREEPDNLPARNPGVLAQEIVVDLESAFEQFCEIAADFVRKHGSRARSLWCLAEEGAGRTCEILCGKAGGLW